MKKTSSQEFAAKIINTKKLSARGKYPSIGSNQIPIQDNVGELIARPLIDTVRQMSSLIFLESVFLLALILEYAASKLIVRMDSFLTRY